MKRENGKERKKISKGNIVYVFAVVLLLALCVTAYLSAGNTEFCDWWKLNVFKPYNDYMSAITSSSESVWGINIFRGLLVYLLAVIVAFILKLFIRTDSYKRFGNGCLKSVLVVFLTVILLYEAIWYIPRNASFLDGSYTPGTEVDGDTLCEIWRYLGNEIGKCDLKYDEHDELIIPEQGELLAAIKRSAGNLSNEFPYLKGELPDAKNDGHSYMDSLFRSKRIASFSLPLTGEIYMYDSYVNEWVDSYVYTHLLAHHKGYFRESEAEFLSYKICKESDEPFVRYIGLRKAYDLIDYELTQRGYPMIGTYDERPTTGPMATLYGNKPDSYSFVEEFGWKMEKKISGDKIYDDVLSLIVEDYRRNKAK